MKKAKIIVLMIVGVNSLFANLSAPTKEDFKIKEQKKGVTLYYYDAPVRDYVLEIDLKYAKIKSNFYPKTSNTNTHVNIKTIDTHWKDAKKKDPQNKLYAMFNFAFFDMVSKLAVPLKTNNKYIEGYDNSNNQYNKFIKFSNINNTSFILDAPSNEKPNSWLENMSIHTEEEIIGGKSIYKNINESSDTGRTFVGIKNNKIYLYSSQNATRQYAIDVLSNFGINEENMIQGDGGGSSQFIVNGVKLVGHPENRKIPHTFGVYLDNLSQNINTFNGTGSIVATDQSTIGGNQDIVALQAGDASMGSFQWYQEEGSCPNLLITNRYNNAEANEVLVVRKGWSSPTIASSFKTTLPFSLSQRDIPNGYNGVYDTILIKSLSSLNKRNQIVAICRNESTYSSSTTVSNPNFKTKDGYTWAGNGSIISQSLSGTGIGKTEDYAYRYADKKSLTIFQWQPSSRCKKLKISASYYDDGFHTGMNFNGKLSTKVWKLDSYIKNKEETSFPYTLSGTIGEYYMLEIRTDETMNSKYKYLYAECME